MDKKPNDKTKTKGDEKKKQEHRKEFLEEVKKAREKLLMGEIQECISLAFKALTEHKDNLGGENSLLLLPALFILVEGNIADKNLQKAQEFSRAAYWNFIKYTNNQQEGNDEEEKREDDDIDQQDIITYRGKLHKTFSKLYLAQKEYDKALDELKMSIYMDSVKYGVNHIITAQNYFQMGNIFLQSRAIPEGEAFYGKTAEIFYKYFKYYFKRQEEMDNEQEQEEIDKIVVQEAFEQQNAILGYFLERYPGDDDKRDIQKALLDSQRALALIFKYNYNENKYQQYIQQAAYECMQWKGQDHPKYLKLKELCESLNNQEQDQYQNQQMSYQDQSQY